MRRIAPPLFLSLALVVASSVSAARTLDGDPFAPVRDAVSALDGAGAETRIARMDALLASIDRVEQELVRRLLDDAEREDVLAEIAKRDADVARAVRDALQADADDATLRTALAPYLARGAKEPARRALEASLRDAAKQLTRERTALLVMTVEHDGAELARALDAVHAWQRVAEEMRGTIHGRTASSAGADESATMRAIANGTGELTEAHRRAASAIEGDVEHALSVEPPREALARGDAWDAILRAGNAALGRRFGAEPVVVDEERTEGERTRRSRALLLVRLGRSTEAREALLPTDGYGRALVVAIEHRIAAARHDALAASGFPEDPALEALDKTERAVVRLVNEYRLALDLEPLEVDARLLVAARGHSREMAELDYFGHDSPNAARRTPQMRARLAGYMSTSIGECIFNGGIYARPDSIVDAWFASIVHNRILSSPSYFEIAVGAIDGRVTANFGGGRRTGR